MMGTMKTIATFAAALAGVLTVTLAACGGGSTSAPSTSTVYTSSTTPKISTSTSTAAVTTTTTPQPATPKYNILWTSNNQRWADKKTTYYVVIDPVDLSNDGFKQNVKLILREIATKSLSRDGPNFSAFSTMMKPLLKRRFHTRKIQTT